MPKYEVFFYLDVVATCVVEAKDKAEALKIASTEDWDYTDESVYEHQIREVIDNEFDPEDICRCEDPDCTTKFREPGDTEGTCLDPEVGVSSVSTAERSQDTEVIGK